MKRNFPSIQVGLMKKIDYLTEWKLFPINIESCNDPLNKLV